ncbi:MAG: hypothetical protein JNK40_06610 [Chromatiales bacterium]|nr:hypothetical protein [Chromatiales bacterium]
MSVERINPALSIEAQFLGPVDGDLRTTRFVLRDEPDVAAWLLTILDFILYRQGKLPDERRIAPPPGGEPLQRLIAGAVVLADRRPDGGLALRLNPGIEVRLGVSARLPGEPARTAMLHLAGEPELARWLVHRAVDGTPADALPADLPVTLADALRRHGILVTELPPPEAYFPDPELPPDPAADLATAARVIPQPAGQAVPAEVRELLGRHTPRLPPAAPLLWALDAGTGLAWPVLRGDGPGPGSGQGNGFRGAGADARAAAWDRQLATARTSLRDRHYAVLREILAPAHRAGLRRYVRQLVQRGYFPALGDGQVELRSALHNESTIASLHRGLARILSGICGDTVQASYCYLGCYEAGAVLPRHKDRPQCSYNLSLVLDMQDTAPDSSLAAEPEPWPIYLEIDGRPEPVLLRVGDGLTYSGTDLWHWREALPPGQRAIVCFFHFVPGDFAGSLD